MKALIKNSMYIFVQGIATVLYFIASLRGHLIRRDETENSFVAFLKLFMISIFSIYVTIHNSYKWFHSAIPLLCDKLVYFLNSHMQTALATIVIPPNGPNLSSPPKCSLFHIHHRHTGLENWYFLLNVTDVWSMTELGLDATKECFMTFSAAPWICRWNAENVDIDKNLCQQCCQVTK